MDSRAVRVELGTHAAADLRVLRVQVEGLLVGGHLDEVVRLEAARAARVLLKLQARVLVPQILPDGLQLGGHLQEKKCK